MKSQTMNLQTMTPKTTTPKTMTLMKRALALGTAVLGMAGSASAHVTLANGPAKPESYVVIQLQVPHGCAGKPTNEVRVSLPDGFYGAKPQPKAGWEIEIVKGDYAKPYDNHGKSVASGPIEIRWKNGNLPDDNYDVFQIQGKLSGVAAGTALPFKTVQYCGTETERWDEVAAPGADPHALKDPAPVLMIAAGDTAESDPHAGMDHSAHAGMDHGAATDKAAPAAEAGSAMAVTQLGALSLSAGYLKAMLPGQPVGGGYVTITNSGKEADRLVAASSPRAGEVQLHEMAMNGDVMVMRQLDKGIEIPAGATVELKPGSLHMMFMKVKDAFQQGQTVPVTFSFEKAGQVEVDLPVSAAGPARK
ncbi:DUF1775 domain-containing protein [Rhizobium sp. SSA_523]|uniref:copper chaperone PCu(A)C n=1 Tax=Rhizobium sp. SSA_523 TaxID=2952477 RepID=UPI002091183D|nr:DUF1775 domain-containing protein [Rhizobium sp. SSA_523]MCO5733870.1 DUF1775 domain-containing protein [Rhizobium sp. SSA_523]WKC24863.1 DUF1775 domain-containing protein [Rhizobium sp. SSA_523]